MHHLVLYSEDIHQIPIIALGPLVNSRLAVDQLDRHPHPIAGLAQVAGHQAPNAQCSPSRLRVARPVAELEGRDLPHHTKRAEACKLGNDVLSDSLGEVVLLRVARQVGEGQHGDRGPIRIGSWLACRLRHRHTFGFPCPAAANFLNKGLSLGLRRNAHLGVQHVPASLVLLQRHGPLALAGIEPHQRPVGRLPHGIEREQAPAGGDRSLAVSRYLVIEQFGDGVAGPLVKALTVAP